MNPGTEDGSSKLLSKIQKTLELIVVNHVLLEHGVQLESRSLFLFKFNNKFRICLEKMVVHRIVQGICFLAILISCGTLAMRNPLAPLSEHEAFIVYWIDVGATSTIGLEMLVKIVSRGAFFCGKFSYFKDPWNILDFISITVAVLGLTPITRDHSFTQFLKIIWPLMLIGRIEGVKA